MNALVQHKRSHGDGLFAYYKPAIAPTAIHEVLMKKCDKLLREKFGHSDYKGKQKEIIEAAMSGSDVFVLAPTGMGKVSYGMHFRNLELTIYAEPVLPTTICCIRVWSVCSGISSTGAHEEPSCQSPWKGCCCCLSDFGYWQKRQGKDFHRSILSKAEGPPTLHYSRTTLHTGRYATTRDGL